LLLFAGELDPSVHHLVVGGRRSLLLDVTQMLVWPARRPRSLGVFQLHPQHPVQDQSEETQQRTRMRLDSRLIIGLI
jgi:hypothetical protein